MSNTRWFAWAWFSMLGASCQPGPGEAPPRPRMHVETIQEPDLPLAKAWDAEADEDGVARGQALSVKFECARCHTSSDAAGDPKLVPMGPGFDCAGCHEAIRAGNPPLVLDDLYRVQASLHAFLDVPSLRATSRFRRRWVESFLRESATIRPALGSHMPRFAMTPDEAQALAAFLVPTAEPEPPELGDPVRGARIAAEKGCGACHRMTGASLPASPLPIPLEGQRFAEAQRLAPDLRFARERLRQSSLVAWLRDPTSVKPDAKMPTIPLSDAEILDIAAFLVYTPLAAADSKPLPERLPLLDQPVTYAEVDMRIFHRVCRHCHANDAFLGGGGPGFGGGLGFVSRRLDLSSYDGLRSGAMDDEGKRRSIFTPLPDGPLAGTPRIIAHLWTRHGEIEGHPIEGIRGMPLGLPPLSLEDIQLLESWIAQGRPGPVRAPLGHPDLVDAR